MNTIDFTTVPVISDIMTATGISDGWVVVCAIVFILAVIFLVGWISSAIGNRRRTRELIGMRRELLGLQALTNLPPLHEGGSLDDTESLVFASFEELKERQIENAREQRVEYTAHSHEQTVAAENRTVQKKSVAKRQEPKAANANSKVVKEKKTQSEPNVTEQVHDAIYASVTGSWKATGKQEGSKTSSRKKRAKGEPVTNSDIPPIHVTKGAEFKGKTKPGEPASPNLSSRIPRL